MRLHLSLLAVIALFAPLLGFAADWRTPHTSADIAAARAQGSELKPHFLGLSGKVKSVSVGYRDKPIYILTVSDSEGDEEIVVGSLLLADLQPDDEVQVLIDVLLIPESEAKARQLASDSFMALGLCLINNTQGYAKGAEAAESLCQKWYLEVFPKSYQDRYE